MKRIILAMVICAFSVHIGYSADDRHDTDTLSLLVETLNDLNHSPMSGHDQAEIVSYAYNSAKSNYQTDNALRGVVVLWQLQRFSDLELVWWKQKNPVVRRCILILFYTFFVEQGDEIPPFNKYSDRFEENEAAIRKAETKEMRMDKDEHRTKLCPLLKKKLIIYRKATV